MWVMVSADLPPAEGGLASRLIPRSAPSGPRQSKHATFARGGPVKILTDVGYVEVLKRPSGWWAVSRGERRAESSHLAHALWSIGIPTPSARALATDIIHALEGWVSAC